MMAASVTSQASGFGVGAVRPLFTVRPRPTGRLDAYPYDVSADGQRVLTAVHELNFVEHDIRGNANRFPDDSQRTLAVVAAVNGDAKAEDLLFVWLPDVVKAIPADLDRLGGDVFQGHELFCVGHGCDG